MKKQIVLMMIVLMLSSAFIGLVSASQHGVGGGLPRVLPSTNAVSSKLSENGKQLHRHDFNLSLSPDLPYSYVEKERGVKIRSAKYIDDFYPENRSKSIEIMNKLPIRGTEGKSKKPDEITHTGVMKRVAPKPGFIHKLSVSFQLGVRAISGHITSNTTWSGTVYVNGNVIIDAGVTLTITGGTWVLMSPGTTIYVDGTLIAQGSPLVPILFTNDTASTPGFWHGIVINSTAKNVVLDEINVSYAYFGVYANTTNITISHSSFWQDDYGIYVVSVSKDSSNYLDIMVNNNNFRHTHYGIYLDLEASSSSTYSSVGGNVSIIDNHVANVDYVGIEVYFEVDGSSAPAKGELNITYFNNNVSYVYGTSYSTAMEFIGSVTKGVGKVNLSVTNNTMFADSLSLFVYNSAIGAGATKINLESNIENNTFIGKQSLNTWGMEFYTLPESGAQINMSYIVYNNTFNSTEMGISSFAIPPSGVSAIGKAQISEKIFNNYINGTKYGMYLYTESNSSGAAYEITAIYSVHNNTIINATSFGIGVGGDAYAAGSISFNTIYANIFSNVVLNSGDGIHIVVNSNSTGGIPSLNATCRVYDNFVKGATSFGIWAYANGTVSGSTDSHTKFVLNASSNVVTSGENGLGVESDAYEFSGAGLPISDIILNAWNETYGNNTNYGMVALSYTDMKTHRGISNVTGYIRDSNVSGNFVGMYVLEMDGNPSYPSAYTNLSIQHNVIANNDASGISVETAHAIIANNMISGNAKSVYYYDVYDAINEDFSGVFPPTGWTAYSDYGTWILSHTDYAGGTAPEAELEGSLYSNYENDSLVSGVIDTSGFESGYISFKMYVDNRAGGYTLYLMVFNGTAWKYTPWRLSPIGDAAYNVKVPISTSYGLGSPDFRIAFVFTGNIRGLKGWYIDNVKLSLYVSDSWGVKLQDGSYAMIENNEIVDNNEYGLFTDYLSSANWEVTSYAKVENNEVVLNGNVSVKHGAEMKMENVTVRFLDLSVDGSLYVSNSSTITDNVTVSGYVMINATSWMIAGLYTEQYNIEITSSGHVVIQNSGAEPSIVRSASYITYQFWVDSGARFEVYNSKIQNVGWEIFGDEYRHLGLWIASDNVLMDNVTLSENNFGLVIYHSSPVIRKSKIFDNTVVGIWAQESSALIERDNISHNPYENLILNKTSDTVSGNYIGYTSNYGVEVMNGVHAVLKNNTIEHDYIGIELEYGDKSTGVVVENNTVSNFTYAGIYKLGDGYYRISKNTISGGKYGIWVQSADKLSAGLMYSGKYKLMYLPFGLEQVNGKDPRNEIIKKTMSWFGSPSHILLVDESGNPRVSNYYNDSLASAGYDASKRYYWNVATQGTPPETILLNNSTVIWFTGENYLTSQDRDVIANFLGNGGNLMFLSPYAGYYATNYGWNVWFQKWLHARYLGSTEEFNIVGTEKPLDGLNLNIHPYSGDGISYFLPDAILPYGGSISVLQYREVYASEITGNYVNGSSSLGLFVNYTSPVLDGNTLVKNENGLVWRSIDANPVIISNNVSYNTGFGVNINASNVNIASHNFYNNIFAHNGGVGFWIGGANVSLDVEGNTSTIAYNTGDNLHVYASYGAKITLNNDIYGSKSGAGLYVHARFLNLTTKNSYILDNHESAIYAYANRAINGSLVGVKVSHNGEYGIYLFTYGNVSLDMKVNDIYDNEKDGVHIHSGFNMDVRQRDDVIVNDGVAGAYNGEYLYAGDNVNLAQYNTNVSLNTQNGLLVSTTTANVTIEGGRFYKNTNDGVHVIIPGSLNLHFSNNKYSANGKVGLHLGSNGYVAGTISGDESADNEEYGAEILNARDLTITNSHFVRNTISGLYMTNPSSVRVAYSVFTGGTQEYGFYVEYGEYISVSASDFELNTYGIYLLYSNNISVDTSTFKNDMKYGVDDLNTPYLTIGRSNFYGMGTAAIYVENADNVDIKYNTISSNQNGALLRNVKVVAIRNNTVSYSTYDGISMEMCEAMQIDGNVIQHNYLGLYSDHTSFVFGNNTVVYNLGSASNKYTGGLWIENTKVSLYNNIIAYNIRYGIYSDENSIVNWFVTKKAAVKSNPVYMSGNITVETGAEMDIMDVSGSFPDGTEIGMFMWITRSNQYGIYVDNGGRMVVENTLISSLSENPYVFDVRGSMLMDGSIVRYAYVLSVYSSDVLIKGSTVSYGWFGGIAVYNSTPVIDHTVIEYSTYYGLMLYNSSVYLGNDKIQDNRVGILIKQSKNVEIHNIYISDNNIGIKAEGSSFELVNSTIYSVENDVYLLDSSSGYLLNTEFDENSPEIMDSSTLSVNWFLNVTVCDRKGTPVAGASVSLYDQFNNAVGGGVTNAVGEVSWFAVTEYVQTHTGKKFFTPTIVKVTWRSQTFSRAIMVTNSTSLKISVGNRNPVITSTPVLRVLQGHEYRYAVIARDPDGDSLNYSLLSAPAGMTISKVGVITWIPDNSDVGIHYILVMVSDGHGGRAYQGFNLTVVNVNDPPNITSTPVTQVFQGHEYRYVVIAKDPDGDALTYTLLEAPPGMNISKDGIITWVPGLYCKGTYNVTVMVSDGHGGYATQRFNITVLSVNHPPEILNVSVVPREGYYTDTYIFTLTYSDPDGDNASAVFLIIDGKEYEMHHLSGKSPLKGEVYVIDKKLSPGAHVYSFEVVDSRGSSVSSHGYTIFVNTPPSHLWDYILSALLIALIGLIIVDVFLWRYRSKKIPENKEKQSDMEDTQEAIDDMDLVDL